MNVVEWLKKKHTIRNCEMVFLASQSFFIGIAFIGILFMLNIATKENVIFFAKIVGFSWLFAYFIFYRIILPICEILIRKARSNR